jgi:hypothetical protein
MLKLRLGFDEDVAACQGAAPEGFERADDGRVLDLEPFPQISERVGRG